MHLEPKQFMKALTAGVLVSLFAVPQCLVAEASNHLVSPSDLQKAAVDASQKRQQNLDSLNGFLSSDKAQKALASAHMNPQQVQKAVAGLSDDELAQLSARANKAQADFAAGNLNDHDLLIILIAIAALVLIIVAVH